MAMDLLDDETRPGIGTGVDVAQCFNVVAAATAPRDVSQVEAIVDPEIVERCKVLLIDGVPQAELGGDAIIEPLQDRHPIAALRGGRQTE